VARWAGPGTEGYFADLKITPYTLRAIFTHIRYQPYTAGRHGHDPKATL